MSSQTETNQPTPYNTAFYQNQSSTSRQSAQIVLPLVKTFINPKSVVDIGCGVGTWLSVWKELGAENIHGFDGDYVQKDQLQIDAEAFTGQDLSQPIADELVKQYKCDLVSTLEVAEHLPEAAAGQFVETLTKFSDVVLFSAAAPYQGGVGHVNEQWPDYWAEKFKSYNYVAIDCIRPQIWDNNNVSWWYAQNIILFVRQSSLENHPALKQAFEQTHTGYLNKIHPRKYLSIAQPKRKKGLLRRLKKTLNIK